MDDLPDLDNDLPDGFFDYADSLPHSENSPEGDLYFLLDKEKSNVQLYKQLDWDAGFHPGEMVLDFLQNVVGVRSSAVRTAGWVTTLNVKHTNQLILMPTFDERGGLLGVREHVFNPSFAATHGFGEDRSPLIVSRCFTPDPSRELNVADVPVPFREGAFNHPVVWVSYDPVDALLLQECGVNATSLSEPCRTLGSDEGINQLIELGALSAKLRPRGTIIILDPRKELEYDQRALLLGLFNEVIEYGTGSGRTLYNLVRGIRQRHSFESLGAELLRHVQAMGNSREVAPRQLNRRPLWHSSSGGYHAPEHSPPQFFLASELAEAQASKASWLVDGLVVAAGITEFQGQPYHGKTAFLLSLMTAVARGGAFLDQKCLGGPVVLVTEQNAGQISDQLACVPGVIEASLPFHILPAESHYHLEWEQKLTIVRNACLDLDARLVVFDTVAQVAGLGDDNNAAAVRKMLGSLRSISSTGTSVVVVHHSNKTGKGSPTQTGLGSIAFAGAVDHTVRIVRRNEHSKTRHIQVESRLMTAASYAVERGADGVWRKKENDGEPTVARGNSEQPLRRRSSSARDFVLRELPIEGNTGMSADELVHRAATVPGAPKASRIRHILAQLRDSDAVRMTEGTGTKGAPYRYCSVQLPAPKGGGGGMESEE